MSPEYSTIVLDNKVYGRALLASCLAANYKREKPLPVYCITPEPGMKSHPFNVFHEEFFKAMTPQQQGDFFALVSDTEQPGSGDRRFYADSNTLALAETFRRGLRPNFKYLCEQLLQIANEKKGTPGALPDTLRKTSQHSYAAFSRLTDIGCLNAPGTFNLTEAIRKPSIIYFENPIMKLGQTGRMFGRLVMWAGVKAAMYLGMGNHAPTRMFVDEFAQMVSPNTELLYQQARGMVSIIATVQSLKDLVKPGFDLGACAKTNSRVRWHFAIGDDEAQLMMSKVGGETVDIMASSSHSVASLYLQGMGGYSQGITYGAQQVLLPRLSINDIKLANDHPNHSIMEITRGSGWSQFGGFPFVLRSEYHISKTEYERRQRVPWPDLPGMEPNELPATLLSPAPTQAAPAVDAPIETVGRPKKRRQY